MSRSRGVWFVMLLASGLVGTQALASEPRGKARVTRHELRDPSRWPNALEPSRPGVLVAPCQGGGCSHETTKTPSPIDWLKAQLRNLAA